jgi:hypothetical protein
MGPRNEGSDKSITETGEEAAVAAIDRVDIGEPKGAMLVVRGSAHCGGIRPHHSSWTWWRKHAGQLGGALSGLSQDKDPSRSKAYRKGQATTALS